MAKPKDLELLQAAKSNDTGAVRKVLAKIKAAKSKKGNKLKYNINLQDEDGFTALHHAALKGNTEIALSLFDMDCAVDAKDNKGMSPLHLAAWAGQVEVARLMVEKGAEVNMRSSTGDTPLHLACQHGNIEVAEVLIDKHADPTILNRNGSAGLDLACQYGHSQIVQYLLLSEATVKLLNLSDGPRTSDPPLHLAAKTGHADIVRMLVEAGAPINQMGKNGTCLHEAALYGKTEVVKLLLDMKADVDARNSEGHTALDVVHLFTSSKASIEIKLLLKGASESKTVFARATVDFRNIYDPTCLSFKAGDTIMVLEQKESGTWKGKIHDGQRERVGYFPSTTVKLSGAKKARTTSVKEAGVVPRGTYDMVTLPSGSSSPPPPPNKNSAPMSSFVPGKKLPAAMLPVQNKAELLNKLGNLNKTPPLSKKLHVEPISPYVKQNGTSFKPQQTLNYTQVVVGKKGASPPPQQGQIFGKTQYADIVFPASPTEADAGTGVPSLPPKENRSEDAASDGDIWVKNKEKLPLLPPKKGKETTNPEPTSPVEAPPNFKPPPIPVKVERPKLTLEKTGKSSPEQESKTAANAVVKPEPEKPESPAASEGPPTFKPPPVPVKIDQTRLTFDTPAKPPAPVGTPEQVRKLKAKEGYEDMSFTAEPPSAPGTPTKEGNTPQKEEKYTRESVSIRDSPTNRRHRLATYENVELKKKPKAVKELSLLITELDRKEYRKGSEEYVLVNRSNTNTGPLGHKPHSYENIPQPESTPLERHSTPPGWEGGIASQEEGRDYENVETRATTGVAGHRPIQAYEQMQDVSGKHEDLDEPVSPRSTGYTPMKRAETAEDHGHDYINVKQGLKNEADPNIGPGTTQIAQLKMREYNAMFDWLESFKLNVYIDNFVKGGFDMTSMKGLTAEDLTAVSVTKTGHRKKLLAEAAKLPPLTDEFPRSKPADIMTWLKLIGLDQYIPNFLDEGFDDMEFVQDLTVEDLERIEIKKPGHRRKLWMSSSALREADDGNDSGFETNRESSHVQETSFNGNMKPFLETDLDALTKQMGDRHDMNTAPLESAPQENAETNSLLNADDAEDETKIVDAGEEKFGVSSTLVEENEPDLDSILAQVGDESTEYENVPTLQTEKNSEVDSEEKTIGDDKIEQETAVSSPDSRQEPPVDHVSPACESHVQPSLPEPSDHVEQTMTEPSSHVDSSVPTLPDAAKAQTSKKPSPPPVRPKPRSRTGSHDILDQISAPSEISKDKPPSPPVKPKPRVEPPQTKENVKEIAGKFVPTPSGGVSTSPPPVRPKSFKRDPPHIPPNPLNSDPIPRASSFSYYGKTQHQVRDVARGRSGSERMRKTPPPPPPRRSSDKNFGSRPSSSSSSSSVEMFLEEMEIKRRSLESLSPHPERKSSASTNLESSSHTTAGNEDSEEKQVFEEEGLDKQITDILRRKSRDELSIPELPDSPSLVTAEQDVNGNDDAFTLEPEESKPAEKVTSPKDTLLEDINNMLSDFTTELDTMFN